MMGTATGPCMRFQCITVHVGWMNGVRTSQYIHLQPVPCTEPYIYPYMYMYGQVSTCGGLVLRCTECRTSQYKSVHQSVHRSCSGQYSNVHLVFLRSVMEAWILFFDHEAIFHEDSPESFDFYGTSRKIWFRMMTLFS